MIATIKTKAKVKKVNSLKDIKPTDRLAYELGYYKEGISYTKNYHTPENWIPTGEYQEIENTKEFLKHLNENNFKQQNYIIIL